MNQYFSNRHTIRNYSPETIPTELLTQIIDAASHAPNTGNMQWYSVIVTTDPGVKEALAPAHFNQPCAVGAAAVLTFCIDLHRFEAWCRLNAATPGFNNLQSFIAAIIDTSLFAQQVCTIAEMEGLGSCFLGTTAYNAPDIARVLELPKRVVPVVTLTLGYPGEDEPMTPTWRLPVQAIMHNDKYQEPSDAELSAWYAPLEKESAHFVDENNKKTLAQVFTDVRYPRAQAEYFSKIYEDFIRANDF